MDARAQAGGRECGLASGDRRSLVADASCLLHFQYYIHALPRFGAALTDAMLGAVHAPPSHLEARASSSISPYPEFDAFRI